MPTITGSDAAEVLTGTIAEDLINGLGGADTITGGGASDTINAGGGDDLIQSPGGAFGGPGGHIDGGAGVDTLDLSGYQIPAGQIQNHSLTSAEGVATLSFTSRFIPPPVLSWAATPQGTVTGVEVFNFGPGGDDLNFSGLGSITVSGGGGDDRITVGPQASVVFGDAGNDTLVGHLGADRLEGGAGNDTLTGGGGVDTLLGGDGDDIFMGAASGAGAVTDGGSGRDTLDYRSFVHVPGFSTSFMNIRSAVAPGAMEVEIRITGRGGNDQVVTSMATGFEALVLGDSIAVQLGSWTGDLSITDTGYGSELINTGSGADVITLSRQPLAVPLGYRIDAGAGTDRIVLPGASSEYLFQQTSSGWTVYEGVAAIHTFANVEQVQFAAGPAMTFQQAANSDFDASGYLARYADLRAAFGTDELKAYHHFQQYGQAEGRTAAAFDGLSYIASHADLIRAFGGNAAAGTAHYMQYGQAEGRVISFNAADYAASHVDLARIIGTDATQATMHYITYGLNEGRVASGFDSVGYLLSNPDLAGFTPSQARTHWLTWGADEGRVGDALFGREQTNLQFSGDSIASRFESAGDRDWYSVVLPVYQNIVFNGSAGVTGLAVYDATGRLIASDADGRDFQFMITNQQGATGPAQYYLVATSSAVSDYTITRDITALSSDSPVEEEALTHAVTTLTSAKHDPYQYVTPGDFDASAPLSTWLHMDHSTMI